MNEEGYLYVYPQYTEFPSAVAHAVLVVVPASERYKQVASGSRMVSSLGFLLRKVAFSWSLILAILLFKEGKYTHKLRWLIIVVFL